MSDHYEPELGQAFFGNPAGEFAMPEIAHAAVHYLINEIERVAFNQCLGDWREFWDKQHIAGIEIRPYWWGDEESAEAAKPNLAHAGVEVRWYKHPGRGMSCNRMLTPDQWSEWMESALKAVRAADVKW